MQTYKNHPLFYVLLLGIFILYFRYYNITVFEQTGLHIDSLWTAVKFVALYGCPFALAAYFFNTWYLRNAVVASCAIWFCVFILMRMFKSHEFAALYPNSYQCMIVAITVYPLMGVSLILGHAIGSTFGAFKTPD